jgi:NDP-mannose synthase
MGICVYDRRALEYIPPNQHFDLPDLVLQLLANKQKVAGFESDALWLDIGRRDDYAVAQDVFEQNQDQFRMFGWPESKSAKPT